MPGIPGFEQRQSATVAHFTDHDSVWPQPHGGAQQPGHVGVVAGAQEDDVFSIDLQLACVLDHHDAVFAVKPGHGVEDGVGQGGLACAGAAADQNIQPAGDRLFERLALGVRHNALGNIVIQGKDQRRLLPQRKARTLDQGRNQGFKAAAVQRQLAFEDGLLGRHHGIEHGRYCVDNGQRPHGVDTAGLLHAFPQSIHPQGAVRVEHDFDNLGVLERGKDFRTHRPAQGFGLAGMGELCIHSRSPVPG